MPSGGSARLAPVGQIHEFREGEMRVCRAGSAEIGVVMWRDSFYAVRNVCPHQGAPICLGRIGPKIVAVDSAVGSLDLDESAPVLACGWHGWEFDVRTGRPAWEEPGGGRSRRSYHLRTFPVVVKDGAVFVDLAPRRERVERTGADLKKSPVHRRVAK
jgi:nitrite reductase/ring-hydroxylating ferredoxin subunit